MDARAPSSALLESAAPLGNPLVPEVWKTAMVAAGSMAAGGNGAPVCIAAGTRRNPSSVSVSSSAWIQVRTSQRVAVCDVAFEDGFVGDQNLGAAVGQDAAHLGQREHAGSAEPRCPRRG